MEEYLIARPILSHLKLSAISGKRIGVLSSEVDPDGRMRTSYNIEGQIQGASLQALVNLYRRKSPECRRPPPIRPDLDPRMKMATSMPSKVK